MPGLKKAKKKLYSGCRCFLPLFQRRTYKGNSTWDGCSKFLIFCLNLFIYIPYMIYLPKKNSSLGKNPAVKLRFLIFDT